MTICKWHLCEEGPGGTCKEFNKSRATQDFCCDHCRAQRAAWRQRRGSTIVDLVLEGKWAELRRVRETLKEEVGQ